MDIRNEFIRVAGTDVKGKSTTVFGDRELTGTLQQTF